MNLNEKKHELGLGHNDIDKFIDIDSIFRYLLSYRYRIGSKIKYRYRFDISIFIQRIVKKILVLAVFYKIKQKRQGAKNRVKVTCLRNYFEVRRSDELNKRSSRQVKIYRKIKFIYKYFDSFCQKFCYFNIEYRIEISIYRIDIVSNQKSFYRNYRNIDISISLCPIHVPAQVQNSLPSRWAMVASYMT